MPCTIWKGAGGTSSCTYIYIYSMRVPTRDRTHDLNVASNLRGRSQIPTDRAWPLTTRNNRHHGTKSGLARDTADDIVGYGFTGTRREFTKAWWYSKVC